MWKDTEAEREWHQAWETGTCPSCGRHYNPSLEAQVEVMSQDPGVVHRARNKRAAMVTGGLLLIALTFLLHHLGVKPSHLAGLIVTGVVLAITGAFHSARHQARTELTGERRGGKTGLDELLPEARAEKEARRTVKLARRPE